jgi:hypothetical protein
MHIHHKLYPIVCVCVCVCARARARVRTGGRARALVGLNRSGYFITPAVLIDTVFLVVGFITVLTHFSKLNELIA